MRPHTPQMIEEMVVRAKNLVAEGEQRLRAQEARVVELERKGRKAPESRKLLKLLRETQALQIRHVSLLEWEFKVEEDSSVTAA